MCTVSFIPVKDGFYITTNRDEKNSRKTALHPAAYIFNNQEMFFPKDADAGGTWIVMKENGDTAVLINGAFENHEPTPPYRQSRGIILLELFSTVSPSDAFEKKELDHIEPFTIILFEENRLYEFRWDGNKKYFKPLEQKPYTWCSATLYTDAAIKIKEQLFASFLADKPMPDQKDILHFHNQADYAKFQNAHMQVNEALYSTVSITSILISKTSCSMYYLDLKNEAISELFVEKKSSLLTLNEKNF